MFLFPFRLATPRTTLPYSDKRKQLTNHPNLSKWCFRLELAYSTSIPSLEQKHSSCWKIFKSRYNVLMILHWCQCTWQTHLAHLREMSFSRVASFCQCAAVHCTLYSPVPCMHWIHIIYIRFFSRLLQKYDLYRLLEFILKCTTGVSNS